VAVILVGLVATACERGGAAVAPTRPPKQGSTSPTLASPTPSSSPPPAATGPAAEISIANLTFGHAEITTAVDTAPIDPPPHALVLAHVMGFWHGGPAPPALSGAGLTWSLVGGNLDGEKRHWVFRGVGDPAPGPVRIEFDVPAEILWVIDAVRGAATGHDGADAIAQFVSQESQRNAAEGSIQLQPFEDPVNNAAVCFALAGSGAASDIVPADGFAETAEAQNPGPSLILSTFWRVGEGTSCDADFLQESSGVKQVQSWLFLAIEVRAAREG
jgi:hypothetical protein